MSEVAVENTGESYFASDVTQPRHHVQSDKKRSSAARGGRATLLIFLLSAANAMPAGVRSCCGLSTAPLPPLPTKGQSEVRYEDGWWA